MKKIITMLFLILSLSIAISPSVYARGVIRKGNLLIYNETPFSNGTVLFFFRRYWSKQPLKAKQRAEAIYYWVIKAGFKLGTHNARFSKAQQRFMPVTGCFAYVSVFNFLKPNKYIIKFNSKNDTYHTFSHGYRVFLGYNYLHAKEKVASKRRIGGSIIQSYRVHPDGSVVISCNHRFYKSNRAIHLLRKYLIKQTY